MLTSYHILFTFKYWITFLISFYFHYYIFSTIKNSKKSFSKVVWLFQNHIQQFDFFLLSLKVTNTCSGFTLLKMKSDLIIGLKDLQSYTCIEVFTSSSIFYLFCFYKNCSKEADKEDTDFIVCEVVLWSTIFSSES